MYSMNSPFAPSRGAAAGLAQTYHQIGVETGVNTASPHKLVAMLFDGLLNSLALAQGAMEQGDIEAKCHQISRGHLRVSSPPNNTKRINARCTSNTAWASARYSMAHVVMR